MRWIARLLQEREPSTPLLPDPQYHSSYALPHTGVHPTSYGHTCHCSWASIYQPNRSIEPSSCCTIENEKFQLGNLARHQTNQTLSYRIHSILRAVCSLLLVRLSTWTCTSSRRYTRNARKGHGAASANTATFAPFKRTVTDLLFEHCVYSGCSSTVGRTANAGLKPI